MDEDERLQKGRASFRKYIEEYDAFRKTWKKRGKADPDKQLYEQQLKLLEWLLSREEEIKASGDIEKERGLYDRGIGWSRSPKRFFSDTYPDEEWGRTKSSSISTSLSRLAARGLVTLRDSTLGRGKKSRTSHVKLTDEGREVARALTCPNESVQFEC